MTLRALALALALVLAGCGVPDPPPDPRGLPCQGLPVVTTPVTGFLRQLAPVGSRLTVVSVVAVIESMGLDIALGAPHVGAVTGHCVNEGTEVVAGQPLFAYSP